MITILAEKPSVAKDISNVLNATKRNNGYFSNEKYNVTWSFGHLVTLAMPKDYGQKEWSITNLPILPSKFKLVPINNSGVKKQLKIINQLFNNSDTIIVATDAGREGELIFRLIFNYLKPNTKNIQRLWISDLTPQTIKEGFKNLKPIKQFDNLYYSAMARACADWMVGINFTQAITLSSQKNHPISVGRVQTPTLKIIVDRYNSNKTFISKVFYKPSLIFSEQGKDFALDCTTNFETKKEAEFILSQLSKTYFLEFTNSKKKNNAPRLYDLTALQKDAYALFKFTAQETLNTAQSLYEQKIITYPRTDSQYLATNQINSVSTLLENILNQFNVDSVHDYLEFDSLAKSKNFNNAKVSDHHAIIPTINFKEFGNLSEKEIRLFYLILKRFVEAFAMTSINSNVSIETSVNGLVFRFTNTINQFLGWQFFTDAFTKVFKEHLMEKKEKESKTFDFLYSYESGDYNLSRATIEEGKTKAPSLLNDSSLLTAMENSGKLIDEDVTEVIKDKGLGTPATRASIIEVLIKREYVKRVKNSFIPTQLGISLIDSLKNYRIVDAEFTGKMEFRLNMIEKGNENLVLFMKESKGFVTEELPNIINAGSSLKNIKSETEKVKDFSFGKCPKCEKGQIRKSKKGAYCSNFKQESNSCDFFLFKKIASKTLSEKNIKDLVTKGKTNKIKGFKSKAGKPFEAIVQLDNNFKTKFCF